MNNNTTWNIFNKTNIGLEFEFYTNLSAKEITRDLEKILDIKIGNINNNDKSKNYKLIKDLSGGRNMFEFITPPKKYLESIFIISKMFEYIKEKCYTTNKSAFQFSFSFDKELEQIEKLNIIKTILSYDENLIYKHFLDRKYSVYAKSIKDLKPSNEIINVNDFLDISNFHIPSDKYYGLNFQHLTDNYLECRYCGGMEYENKFEEVREIMEYTIKTIYNCLLYPKLTEKETLFLKNKTIEISNKIKSIENYNTFLIHYGRNITLTVDMELNYDIINYRFKSFQKELFNIIVLNDIKTCKINLDTDRNKIQISNLSNKKITLKNIEIFKSKLSGCFENCNFFDCELNYSDIKNSNITNNNHIKNSKIYYSIIGHTNKIYQSFIKSHNDQLISGNYKKSIITGGSISNFLIADKDTEILGTNFKEFNNNKK